MPNARFGVAASLTRRPGRRLAAGSRPGRQIIATEAAALLARAPVFTARPKLRSRLTTRRHVRVGVVTTQVLVIVDVLGERLVGPGRVLDLVLRTVDVHLPLRCVDPLHETYRQRHVVAEKPRPDFYVEVRRAGAVILCLDDLTEIAVDCDNRVAG